MKRFNLSEWAITHRALVLFMILLLGAAGIYSYLNLGRAEDPSFTIKTMVVQRRLAGSDRHRTCRRRSPTRSRRSCRSCPISTASRAIRSRACAFIRVTLSDKTPPAKVKELWYQVRKKVGDIRGDLAAGHHRPEFQRRIRRRLFGALHAHGRRPEPRRAQGARRGHPPAPAAGSRRQQGRHHRRAAAEDLHRVQPRQAGHARRHARSRSSTASPSRTPSSPAARSIPRPTASICA